ncbi:MAG TPA: DUF2059 domain-containing protein [Bradyrhizobium sp.]|nr:DUF2059 domain-containing protein [Bradyrhizobium sp.]
MVGYVGRLVVGVVALQLFLSMEAVRAQAPENLVAAKELVETMHLNDQYKAIIPGIVKNLKPAIVQGRVEVDQQYDALAPIMIEGFQQRASEMIDAAAIIYARTFSTEELHALNEFYKTSAGQKMLQKLPGMSQELLAAGAKFGQSVGKDIQQRMIEEMRKKGINL